MAPSPEESFLLVSLHDVCTKHCVIIVSVYRYAPEPYASRVLHGGILLLGSYLVFFVNPAASAKQQSCAMT